MSAVAAGSVAPHAERIRVRGAVQGVGFRPTVWRLAQQHGVHGWVSNDGEGVIILACAPAAVLDAFVGALPRHSPPLARIDGIERVAVTERAPSADFRIVDSQGGPVRTGVVADAATCPQCLAEINDPAARRYRYPFTNCTHCGPRLSIIDAVPYDRARTTLRDFALCPECAAEYADPADRRFHAQPIACPVCGPRVWLESADGYPLAAAGADAADPATHSAADAGDPEPPWRAPTLAGGPGAAAPKHFVRRGPRTPPPATTPTSIWAIDEIDAAARLIEQGYIVAIKGLGGFQLACAADNETAVARLRLRKQRERKPFALMARDLDVVRRYGVVSDAEAALLQSPAAPIVILETSGSERLAAELAPGVATLGMMLPNTPLHHLLLQRMTRPIVLTSGNLCDEPQSIDNADARDRLFGVADAYLMHDRGVARRVDDTVLRVIAGQTRMMRRARGYAPGAIRLPDGFAAAPPVLAMGAELKNTFCLLRDGEAIVSQHVGDLADARCHADYTQSIAAYQALFAHQPRIVAVDKHPEYLSRKLGLTLADERGLACAEIQHHHAHIAACLAENGVALDTPAILGVALDGLGYGDDGTLWGGEFLLADYRQSRRVVSFKPTAMPGGTQAIHEPWRNTYAQLAAAFGWERFAEHYGELELCRFLDGKPRALLDGMIERGVNSPLASSCGRLFDAVAAAAGVCRDKAWYEGQAAVEFEALIDRHALATEDDALAYPFAIAQLGNAGLPCIDPLPMWQALLADSHRATPLPLISARFHKGLAIVIADLARTLARHQQAGQALDTVALSGGVLQNRALLEQLEQRLTRDGFRVLTHRRTPANDGGLALGQAAIAAARALAH